MLGRGAEFCIHNTVKLSNCVRKTNCENCQVTSETDVVKAMQHKCFQWGAVWRKHQETDRIWAKINGYPKLSRKGGVHWTRVHYTALENIELLVVLFYNKRIYLSMIEKETRNCYDAS